MGDEARNVITRRDFVDRVGLVGAALGLGGTATAAEPAVAPVDADGRVIAGFEPGQAAPASGGWRPVSDRRIRVGIAGFGLCQFGAQFGFQDHPNVEVAAVTDLIPARRDGLAKACRCAKNYDSCEEMLKDDALEAVYIATDAPSHARLAIAALERGKHVASAVPAVWGSLEDADQLLEAVKKSGRKYMMFETSCFHADLYAWHQRHRAGRLGKLVYSEGEYYHHFATPLRSYNPKSRDVDGDGWRKGLPPMWYPTHATAFYVGVTGGSFTEVSALGMPSDLPQFQAANNDYGNPFGTEIALLRTSEGGMARMAVGWDMPAAGGEQGRVYGQKNDQAPVDTNRPPLPPGVGGGGHGGSHGHLTNEFVDAILRDRAPWVDVTRALAMTVAGIVAHQSALKGGELLKIPQYAL